MPVAVVRSAVGEQLTPYRVRPDIPVAPVLDLEMGSRDLPPVVLPADQAGRWHPNLLQEDRVLVTEVVVDSPLSLVAPHPLRLDGHSRQVRRKDEPGQVLVPLAFGISEREGPQPVRPAP